MKTMSMINVHHQQQHQEQRERSASDWPKRNTAPHPETVRSMHELFIIRFCQQCEDILDTGGLAKE